MIISILLVVLLIARVLGQVLNFHLTGLLVSVIYLIILIGVIGQVRWAFNFSIAIGILSLIRCLIIPGNSLVLIFDLGLISLGIIGTYRYKFQDGTICDYYWYEKEL